METNSFFELPVCIGVREDGRKKVIDLTECPHLLVAGATKQGKTVCVRNIIHSLITYNGADKAKLVLFDPKGVELQAFNGMEARRFFMPGGESSPSVIGDAKAAEKALEGLLEEKRRRERVFKNAYSPNIQVFNAAAPEEERLPYIAVVIDEYADLIFGKERKGSPGRRIMDAILELSGGGERSGIHMVITTQRPDPYVITKEIRANFPSRIAFRVSTREDSKLIVGTDDASRLDRAGDMIFFTRQRIAAAY